jgi:hypothetical protein
MPHVKGAASLGDSSFIALSSAVSQPACGRSTCPSAMITATTLGSSFLASACRSGSLSKGKSCGAGARSGDGLFRAGARMRTPMALR